MSWRSFCQKLIFFLVVAGLVFGLVVGTGAQVTVALGAAAAVAVVTRDLFGPHAGRKPRPAGRSRKSPDGARRSRKTQVSASREDKT